MSSLSFVIVIAAPVMVILMLLVVSARKKQAELRRRGSARIKKDYISDLYEALEFIVKVDNNKDIQALVAERLSLLHQQYLLLLPKSMRASGAVIDVLAMNELVEHGGNKRRILKSDREIRYAKRQFSRVLKSFPSMIKSKDVSESSVLEYRRYLRISLLDMEVDSFTAQGEVAAQKGDVTTASSYYKAARKLLIEFNMQYPEKTQKIRDLSQKSSALFNGRGVEEEPLPQSGGPGEGFGLPNAFSDDNKKSF